MFGYVTVNQEELKIKDYRRYRSFYCGLCRTLSERHGKQGQLTLTYDMTFLVILLNGLYEKPLCGEQHSCILHPLKKQKMVFNDISAYAADMGVLLSYYKMLDDVRDEKSGKARVLAKAFEKDAHKISERYPRQSKAVSECLQSLYEYENAGEYDLDKVSGLTGTLLGEIFVYEEGEWSRELRRMGFYLGKFIYLMDAFDDLEKDLKKNEYNPWRPLLGQKDFDATVENTMIMMMSECAKEFEKLPIVQDVDILRNIIYSGVWTKYEAVRKKRDEEKEERR
ncbi:MAG TPA: DUF5685 family protein [Lachnospiraceae bacterium]|nr:DUF5685 family protein [Lachnospiraceae bacterium]